MISNNEKNLVANRIQACFIAAVAALTLNGVNGKSYSIDEVANISENNCTKEQKNIIKHYFYDIDGAMKLWDALKIACAPRDFKETIIEAQNIFIRECGDRILSL